MKRNEERIVAVWSERLCGLLCGVERPIPMLSANG